MLLGHARLTANDFTASGNVTCLFPRDTGSIPGADGDLPRDGRNTPQFAHHVAARVAAAAAAAARSAPRPETPKTAHSAQPWLMLHP